MEGNPCPCCHTNNPTLATHCGRCTGVIPGHETIERITIKHEDTRKIATINHEERVPLWTDVSEFNLDENGNEQDKTPRCMAVQIEVFGIKCSVVISEDHSRGVNVSVVPDVVALSLRKNMRIAEWKQLEDIKDKGGDEGGDEGEHVENWLSN
ncbi:uncharacterized protein EAE97_010211 [Botrytis byssoidea]|uniref:Uncharacterized protein n=1 Tax=Botrytis byssoidea TaxID=139641 RepID=A0A9P5LNV6_9HELO|nr:uncharacterized protein EAE97_010211 [Botrytis byssoidea]KAF7926702.1 hypothetical protein EAE97_010211 [Botrytis byssoidea]